MNQLRYIYEYKICLQSEKNIFRRLKSAGREIVKLSKASNNLIGHVFFGFHFCISGLIFGVYILTVVLFLRVREIVD